MLIWDNAVMPTVPNAELPDDLAEAAHNMGVSPVVLTVLYQTALVPRSTARALADASGLALPTVQRTLTRLLDAGLVQRDAQLRTGRGHAYHYWVSRPVVAGQLAIIGHALLSPPSEKQ